MEGMHTNALFDEPSFGFFGALALYLIQGIELHNQFGESRSKKTLINNIFSVTK